MISKKAQGIIEFLVVFIAVFFFFVLFISIINENVGIKNLEKRAILAMDLALSVQDEINLAQKSSEGYYRTFTVPNQLLGVAYDITIAESRVVITSEKIALSYTVTNVTGNVQKGLNTIKKENGKVLLN